MTTQTLALAAALQSLSNVVSVANTGHSRRDEVEPCVQALLTVYEGDFERLYGGREALAAGLRQLVEQLERPRDPILTRYLVAVLYLERRLRKRPSMMAHLGNGLANARRQAEYFERLHPNVISNLGSLYSETISTLRPRIMVVGGREYLEQPSNANLIRTLLLSAIRAATFWREAGGNRWRLLFGRQKYVERARELLRQLQGP